jgi:hypothetical protein
MDHVINYLQIYDEKTNKTFQRGIITPEVSDAGCYLYMTDSTDESCFFSILPTQMSLWLDVLITRKNISKEVFELDSTDCIALRFAFLKSHDINEDIKFYEIYKWNH